mmetsp:Transcript_2016/g.7865  ORF Transcript_2016/g.7865 Transcript_2016/m.7865 type:complete len:262 (+) Transcript_2016:557-1342(+)
MEQRGVSVGHVQQAVHQGVIPVAPAVHAQVEARLVAKDACGVQRALEDELAPLLRLTEGPASGGVILARLCLVQGRALGKLRPGGRHGRHHFGIPLRDLEPEQPCKRPKILEGQCERHRLRRGPPLEESFVVCKRFVAPGALVRGVQAGRPSGRGRDHDFVASLAAPGAAPPPAREPALAPRRAGGPALDRHRPAHHRGRPLLSHRVQLSEDEGKLGERRPEAVVQERGDAGTQRRVGGGSGGGSVVDGRGARARRGGRRR